MTGTSAVELETEFQIRTNLKPDFNTANYTAVNARVQQTSHIRKSLVATNYYFTDKKPRDDISDDKTPKLLNSPQKPHILIL